MYVVLMVLMIMLVGMSCTRIDAGYIGLKVDMMGEGKGSVTEIPPGYQLALNPSVSYFSFPQFTQTYKWTEGKDDTSPNDEAIRFQTSEGLQITADVGISFAVSKEKGAATSIYLKYRRGVEELIDSVIRNKVRDTFMIHGSRYTADQIIGDRKGDLLLSVEKDVKNYFLPEIEIASLSWLSSPRPPQSVIDALNLKVQATQLAMQKENEVRTAKAEADKAVESARGRAESVTIEATAQAKANKLLSDSMTDRLIQAKYIEKWDGKLPTVQSGSGGANIIDLRGLNK